MIKTAKFVLFLLLGMCIWAEAVDFSYTWKSPEAETVSFKGKKVAVILMSTNRSGRLAAEEALAKELTKRGAEGVVGHTLVTESELKDQERAKSRFKEQGISGALVMRATPEGDEPVDPNMWKDPMYKDIWGFTSKSWNEEGKTYDEVKFRVEVAVYSMEQNSLIWLGTTQMKSTKLVEFIQGVVDEIAEEMIEAGLLVPKQ